MEDGLPDDVSYKIIEDKEQNLWFGTNNGLVRFNPLSHEIKVFSQNDGLPINQFNYKSAIAGSDGMFYFGTLNGLIAFDPYSFVENKFTPPVYITKLTMFNKEITLNSENSPLKKTIAHSRKLTLSHDQSNIGFNFVALSYTAPEANNYAYKMEGIDKDWTYTDNNHTASYAKLPSGKYTFLVKGSNNDNLWNEAGAMIDIEILPPWWASLFAYFVYFLITILCVYLLIRNYLERTNKRQEEKQKLFETEKEKELYSSKVEFFTNIAHEIRTPVTLISGPLESMMEMEIGDMEIRRNLGIMNKNTSDLLALVNQLLDYRKVDSNKFLISKSTHNLTEIIKEIYSRFELTAYHETKKMTLLLPESDVFLAIDKGAITKILNNLLSNALHYSDDYIEVELLKEDEFVYIKVRNDGEVVPVDLREKIFDPFYQIRRNQNTTSTSGIGLSLARSLAGLHKCDLCFEEYFDMNQFVLKISLTQEDTVSEEKTDEDIPEEDYILEEETVATEIPNAEIVLIVEDNQEMLTFIANKLCKQFIVEKATTGIEALKVLQERNIDLVLTDVMMPEMDGFNLCKAIKENLEYSHIPVVLLTAKNDLKSKIHGLEMGADAYVEKPFSMSHLITQLITLLSNRRREKEAFVRKPFLPIQNIGMNKADEQFIRKVIDTIQENITDSNFNVDRLSESVFMSRSSLHRKIKALTELAPIDFIRLIRLRKAAELIKSGEYRIGEVCYLVGINSPSYFIKLFQKQFSVTPKEFSKQL